MINFKNVLLMLMLLAGLSFTSCKKKNDCKAGIGGNVILVAKPQHHGTPILNKLVYPDSAFLKFDTQDYPGPNPSDYDAIFVGDSVEDHVHIEGLKCGDYYIYMTGYDSTINQRVKGGLPLSFSIEDGEIDLVVPVTE